MACLPTLSSLFFLTVLMIFTCSATSQLTCNTDNCLRAVRRSSTQVAPFCSSYLSTPPASTATLPAFATSACSQSAPRISSACECLISSPPKTVSSSPPTPTPTPATSFTELTRQSPCCLCCAFAGYSLVGPSATFNLAQASDTCKQRCSATAGCETVYVEHVNNEGDFSWYCIYKNGKYEAADTDCGGSAGGTCVEVAVFGKS